MGEQMRSEAESERRPEEDLAGLGEGHLATSWAALVLLILLLITRTVPAMSSIARTLSLDHLVLTVQDLDATVHFYQTVLGMQPETFVSASSPDTKRYALKFGTQKINLHVRGQEFEPKAQSVQPGSADLCFLVQDNVDDVLKGLQDKGIAVLEGGQVVDRTGAQGKIRRCAPTIELGIEHG